MCLIDILGKGRKIRTIPVAEWAKLLLDEWKAESFRIEAELHPRLAKEPGFLDHFHVLRRIKTTPVVSKDPSGRLIASEFVTGLADQLTEIGTWWIVTDYGKKLGVKIAPHDLRRTLAKLMYGAGSDVKQIQYMLGHSKFATTEVYLGSELELGKGKAGVDKIEIVLGGAETQAKSESEGEAKGEQK